MRVALITTSWPATEADPAGHFVRASARELERAGHEIVLVAPEPGSAFGWPGVAARLRQRPLRAIEAARWVAQARARASRLEVDLVAAHWAVPCAWPIGVASRAPLEVTSHGGDVRLLAALPRVARNAIARAVASRASVWRFASATLMHDLLAFVDRPTRARIERIAIVQAPPFEMPDVRTAIDQRRRDLAGSRVAVSVGRLVSTKRVDRAIEHVAATRDADVLVIVGEGPERARLEQLARSRGVDARFVGTVERHDALAWIGAADVLLHASEAEGLSTVVREAEVLGTPVVRIGAAGGASLGRPVP
jgi:teichuronic acid biosynthesis glycosyltransferase TuaC